MLPGTIVVVVEMDVVVVVEVETDKQLQAEERVGPGAHGLIHEGDPVGCG